MSILAETNSEACDDESFEFDASASFWRRQRLTNLDRIFKHLPYTSWSTLIWLRGPFKASSDRQADVDRRCYSCQLGAKMRRGLKAWSRQYFRHCVFVTTHTFEWQCTDAVED